ncbi:hypothetical protein [Halorubrum sp. AS12]|uniref:hypothetical protein n=1 Tax=Halorubrum sp. AS12 TaxID=3409687 RepID=UPI003DA71271
MFDTGIVATIVGPVFVPVTLFVPGLLAVSVLARVVRHGLRLVSAYVSSGNRAQRDETIPRRIGMSLVLGALAGYTLWWVIASVYVLAVADTGSVMLAPLVALVAGSVLGVLLSGEPYWGDFGPAEMSLTYRVAQSEDVGSDGGHHNVVGDEILFGIFADHILTDVSRLRQSTLKSESALSQLTHTWDTHQHSM